MILLKCLCHVRVSVIVLAAKFMDFSSRGSPTSPTVFATGLVRLVNIITAAGATKPLGMHNKRILVKPHSTALNLKESSKSVIEGKCE